MKCFVDMDGVLVDFVGGACRAHGVENPYGDPLSAGQWDIANLCGIDPVDFWSKMNNHFFWAGLRPTRDLSGIMNAVESVFSPQNVCLLTSPTESGGSASGKMAWIDRHLHAYRRRFLIGPPKHFYAHLDTVLVDDNDKNVDDFVRNGGRAILVPRPWNRDHAISGDSVRYVEGRLDELAI